jgi:flagellar hook protein FlgE
MNWNLFNGGAPRITQFAQPPSVSANDQDGQPSAQLTNVGLAGGGQVMAQYSNGTQMVVGQVALASIRNPESLIAVGSNNFETSAQSALPAIGVPNTGGRGQVVGGSLEASTVDIAREFTDLIVFQRAYEANSKIITASNELSQTTTNLIR